MAVGRVGIEGHVADDAEGVAEAVPDRPHGAAGEVVGVAGMAAVVGLEGRLDHGKDRHRRDAELNRLLGRPQDALDRQPLDARHARHRQGRLVVVDEHRPDQIGRREHGLGDGPPEPVVPPQPPQAGRRERPGRAVAS